MEDKEMLFKWLQTRHALIEQLADIEHQRWADWQNYMHGKCGGHPDGSLRIPEELVSRWNKQAKTSYSELSEKEKESDREQVRRYLPLLEAAISRAIAQDRQELMGKIDGMMPETRTGQQIGYVQGLMDCKDLLTKI